MIDLFNRQVAGCSVRGNMMSNIVIDALRIAKFKNRLSKLVGTLFLSNQSSQ